LPDEVGRRDARDPETVRDLGRNRRLAGARRAADKDHDRELELTQVLVAAKLPQRLAPFDLTEHLDGERLEPLELDHLALPSGEIVAGAARERVRAVRRHADSHQRARHQAARVRQPVLAAERERHDPPRLVHPRSGTGKAGACAPWRAPSSLRACTACSSSERTRSSSPGATTSFAASTTRAPCASACSATMSIAAAFSSTRYVSASTRGSSSRSRSRRARFRETCTTSASRWS